MYLSRVGDCLPRYVQVYFLMFSYCWLLNARRIASAEMFVMAALRFHLSTIFTPYILSDGEY